MPPLISSTLQMDPARHFDRAAEGDFAVALAEMQIAHRKPGARHIDREKHPRPTRQILDVAVAAMLARRDRSRSGRRGGRLRVALQPAHMRGRRGTAHWPEAAPASGLVAIRPVSRLFQVSSNFGIRQTADQPGMNEPREAHARHMA